MWSMIMAVPAGILGYRLQVSPFKDKIALNAEIVNGSKGVVHHAWNKSREAIGKKMSLHVKR